MDLSIEVNGKSWNMDWMEPLLKSVAIGVLVGVLIAVCIVAAIGFRLWRDFRKERNKSFEDYERRKRV